MKKSFISFTIEDKNLKAVLQEEAAKNHRSLAAQIRLILEDWVEANV